MSGIKKYVVWPGLYRTAGGGVRNIAARELIWLYGVPESECLVAPPRTTTGNALERLRYAALTKMRHLHPRANGNYKL